MGSKTYISLALAGLLALSVFTETTFANVDRADSAKEIIEVQKKMQLKEGIIDSSILKQVETNINAGLAYQNTHFTQASTSTLSLSASDYLVETEPNDDFAFADQLSYSQSTIGQILPNYDVDFYKVNVPKDGILLVGGGSTTIALDLMFAAIEKDWNDTGKLDYLGSEYNEGVEIQMYQAKAGTYYVPVLDADEYYRNTSSDLYVMATSYVDNVAPGKPTINKVDNNDTVISGKAEANSTITIKNGSKVIATAKATSKSIFSVKMAVQKAGTKLTATAKDQSGNISSSTSITVVDGIAPAAPTINKITNKDLKVTGKAEANSTVDVKVGKTLLGSAKADTKGNYSVKIKAQKVGAAIAVTAKDKAGNISKKATKAVVKK